MPETVYYVYLDETGEERPEESRSLLGEYPNEEAAVDAAREVIDNFLLTNYQPGMPAQELFDAYAEAGQEVFVPGSGFRAWEYAMERIQALCEEEE